MTSWTQKQLQELKQEKDEWVNVVRTMAQNNLNMKHELDRDKFNLIRLVLSTKEMEKKIVDKRDDVRRIVQELRRILGSYCSHLKTLAEEADKDCDLDWKLYQAGEIDCYHNFLENFLEHRKDYHIYKNKAIRLARELYSLDKILINCDNSHR